LNQCLSKIPQRTLKDANDRIIGEGDKLKGALRRLILAYQKKPKNAFDQWKNYLEMIRNKQLIDQNRAQKLGALLNRIPQRTMNDAMNRIIGGGDKLKGAMRRIMLKVQNDSNNAFYRWKDWLSQVKNKTLFDNLRTQKLTNHLARIPIPTMKKAFDDITKDDKLRSAMRRIMI
jgi:hypothetical protein